MKIFKSRCLVAIIQGRIYRMVLFFDAIFDLGEATLEVDQEI